MIKAVFFDWFNTLAHYYPSREELESQALQELGFLITPDTLRQALYLADKYYYEEHARLPIGRRSAAEQAGVQIQYQLIVLKHSGIAARDDLAVKLMKRSRELTVKFVLYDDVLPALESLRKKNLTVGILSNLQKEINSKCRELGITHLVDFTVTSGEVGAEKPAAPIFLKALALAQVNPTETMHIGDQYVNDVLGARNVGIQPVLLDRDDVSPQITDCPRICGLDELDNLLKQC
ncbi:MAG: HAD-IA family hydrolase [Dehalococcoidales bacterium]|nr:HAD-IA family hydrolase [Dehalococcoidales bacterium]